MSEDFQTVDIIAGLAAKGLTATTPDGDGTLHLTHPRLGAAGICGALDLPILSVAPGGAQVVRLGDPDDKAALVAYLGGAKPAKPPKPGGWWERRVELANFFLAHYAVRTDAYGVYYRAKDGKTKQATAKGPLTKEVLLRHCGGKTVGVHTTCPVSNTSKVLHVDIDRHDDEGDPVANFAYARHLYGRLADLGFRSLLWDSNGRGGYHVQVLWATPAPAALVRDFGLWLTADYAAHCVACPEVFPKQDELNARRRFGNWYRLPGRHHKRRDHWTKCWDGTRWLDGEEAVAHLLATVPACPELIPQEARHFQAPPPARPGAGAVKRAAAAENGAPPPGDGEHGYARLYSGDLRTLDLLGLFEGEGGLLGDRGGYPAKVKCPWHEQHTAGDESAFVWQDDDDCDSRGWPRFFCHHTHCQGKGLEQVLAHFGAGAVNAACARPYFADAAGAGEDSLDEVVASAGPYEFKAAETLANDTPAPEASPTGKKRADSLASRLIALAVGHSERFLCDGKAYLASGRDCFALASTPCRRWLRTLSLRSLKQVANDKQLRDTVESLDAMCHAAGRRGRVYRRLARTEDALYLDLCDADCRAVKITAAGWQVVTEYPVHFLRGPNQAPQAVPTGGSVNDLFDLVNVTADDRPLLLGFLLDCLKGRGPYTVLLVNGPQGSAKSTLTKIVRQVIDPAAKAAARYLQRDVAELALAAEHNALLAYDNVSSLPQWLSDALASLATGAGMGVRRLYTQDEEVIYGDARPIAFNGIPDFAESPDLLDRCVKVTLAPIPAERRKTDEEVCAAFDKALPGVLGDLLNMVSRGLANPDVPCPDGLPRIASTAKWVAACGCSDFAAAYERNRDALTDVAVEGSDLAQGLLILFGLAAGLPADGPYKQLPWEGTATDLLEALNNPTGVVPGCLRDSRRWPKGNTQLATEVNRVAPDLARKGLAVERVTVQGSKRIRIRKVSN
jgi:hypothetical protein